MCVGSGPKALLESLLLKGKRSKVVNVSTLLNPTWSDEIRKTAYFVCTFACIMIIIILIIIIITIIIMKMMMIVIRI